ncbi:MAG TPA: DUF3592 domain-containing protein [Polyangiales bacterium]|nr:DUF3592 domain-containing protein [Polyangiales bacterium]
MMLAIASWLDADFARHKATALSADAVVSGHHETTTQSNGKRSTTGWDEYEYTTDAGHRIAFSVVNSGSQPSRPVGHRARILYQPDNPEQVRLDDGSHELAVRWVRLSSPIGVVVGLIPLLLQWWARRRSSPTHAALDPGAP